MRWWHRVLIMRRNRERFTNAPLRDEIQARVCLSTPLDHVSILGTGGFGGTRGQWIRVKGPKRLETGADAFMISLPSREFVFTGRLELNQFNESAPECEAAAPPDIGQGWVVVLVRPTPASEQESAHNAGGEPS
jgi:hypothetical protein